MAIFFRWCIIVCFPHFQQFVLRSYTNWESSRAHFAVHLFRVENYVPVAHWDVTNRLTPLSHQISAPVPRVEKKRIITLMDSGDGNIVSLDILKAFDHIWLWKFPLNCLSVSFMCLSHLGSITFNNVVETQCN